MIDKTYICFHFIISAATQEINELNASFFETKMRPIFALFF